MHYMKYNGQTNISRDWIWDYGDDSVCTTWMWVVQRNHRKSTQQALYVTAAAPSIPIHTQHSYEWVMPFPSSKSRSCMYVCSCFNSTAEGGTLSASRWQLHGAKPWEAICTELAIGRFITVSQQPVTGSSPEPHESSPHPYILRMTHLTIILPSMPKSIKEMIYLLIYKQTTW